MIKLNRQVSQKRLNCQNRPVNKQKIKNLKNLINLNRLNSQKRLSIQIQKMSLILSQKRMPILRHKIPKMSHKKLIRKQNKSL